MAEFKAGDHTGAVWKRVDFQVHTPRDPKWTGSPHLPGGNPKEEEARRAWARDFFKNAAEAKGLQAVAITDHHDMVMLTYIREAARELDPEGKSLWIFPGMEVTCDDACQALVIFDCNSDETQWNRLSGVLPHVDSSDSKLAKIPPITACGLRIEEFIEAMDRDRFLSPVSIVLPHAGDEGAHKGLLRRQFNLRFKSLPCEGVYTDKAFQRLQDRTKNIVHGLDPQWGNRRRGIIPTGDNRKATFDDLGSSACWIRLGEPTAEAIRQALLVDEARITYERPSLPSQRILQLRVDSSLTGEGFGIAINDGFTALIGGRGSGKSAALEYLRFGLGRSSLDVDSKSEEQTRSQKLLNETLMDGEVAVVLERDGVKETWRRTLADSGTIRIELDSGEKEEATVEAAKQRFRARAYEQKELSTIVAGREETTDQITGIAAAEFQDKRRNAEEAIQRAKRAIRTAFLRVNDFWIAVRQNEQAKIQVADLKRRLDAISAQLKERGLTPADQEILQSAPNYNGARTILSDAKTSIQGARDEVVGYKDVILKDLEVPNYPDDADFDSLRQFGEEVRIVRENIHSLFLNVATRLDGLETHRASVAETFGNCYARFEERYSQAITRQKELRQLVDVQRRLQTELQEAERRERETRRKTEEFQEAEHELNEATTKLFESVAVRDSVLRQAAKRTDEMSAGSLRSKVVLPDYPSEYANALKSLGDGARIHDLESRSELRAAEIGAINQPDAWSHVCEAVLSLYKEFVHSDSKLEGQSVEELRQTMCPIIFDDLTDQQVLEIYKRITVERVLGILTAVVYRHISFEYKDRKEFIPFESASPGQQAAALLHLLLHQEAGTLIIDQPEDDLDNRVIMDIVSILQKTKQKRQIIFATHNPNFVVNGDADKVIALKPSSPDTHSLLLRHDLKEPKVKIDVDGALETPGVREAITETMEGGRKAFELRSRKYRFQSS